MPLITVYFLNKDQESFHLSAERPELRMGRGKDNLIVLEDYKVSRTHARIYYEVNGAYIEDLGSTNGVFVNRKRVKKARLIHNDEIMIGDTMIVFRRDTAIPELIQGVFDEREGQSGKTEKKVSDNLEQMAKQLEKTIAMAEQGKSAINYCDLKKIHDSLTGTLNSCREMEKSYQIMLTLNRINEAVSSVYDLRELLNLIIDMVIKIMNAERGFLMLYSAETKELVPAVARKMHDVLSSEERQGVSKSIASQVAKSGKSIVTTDALLDPRFKEGASIINMNIRSVMCVPLKTRREIVGVLYVDNRQKSHCFNSKDLKLLEGFAAQAATAIEKTKLYADLEESYLASVEVLANVLDASDPYTHGHSVRVSRYSVEIAEQMGLNEMLIKNLRYGSLLHDIGKVGIPPEIINKTGRLSDSEFELIRKHPVKGFEIIKPIKFLEEKLSAIRYHHESFNGKGYPSGLAGTKIPIEARIVAVADSFDAMTSTRSYRQAMEYEAAMAEIRKNSGTQFDPQVVESFLKISKKCYDEILNSDVSIISIGNERH
ncbi:MAG: HD domain-containing protein [Candidatus Wallbacteria bacterium]|nr:HD domain-containing protein [Candidatus Wallbacteria bacterium]